MRGTPGVLIRADSLRKKRQCISKGKTKTTGRFVTRSWEMPHKYKRIKTKQYEQKACQIKFYHFLTFYLKLLLILCLCDLSNSKCILNSVTVCLLKFNACIQELGLVLQKSVKRHGVHLSGS